jgi:peptidoglycan endopeptidase LytE
MFLPLLIQVYTRSSQIRYPRGCRVRRVLLVVVCCLTFFAVTHTNVFSAPGTHKVKSGDNLYSIAKEHRVSVDKLKSWNRLNSTKLKLGQQLVINKDGETRAAGKNRKTIQPEVTVTENDGEFIEYKTKKGDTLDRIAGLFNIDKDDILESNSGLKDKKLKPGRIVLVPKITEEQDEEYVTLTNKPSLKQWKSTDEKYMLVKVAKSFMGAPYKYGGESVRGLDCSAYVKKIYDIFDVQLPRSAREQYHAGAKIQRNELSVGDLVFFKTKRYVKYPTHVGIYIGDGNFIHSSSANCRVGVKIDALASDFYTKTYIGAIRVKKAPDENSAEILKTIENNSNNS